MKLLILIFTIIFTDSAFAKEKTIKFHKPETEAEKALDEILRVDNEIVNGKNKDEETFTKNFIIDDDRKQKEFINEEDLGGCLSRASGRKCGFLTGGSDYATNIGFLYYTNRIENGIMYIYALDMGYEKLVNESNRQKYLNDREIRYQHEITKNPLAYRAVEYKLNYAMRKENDKWKIDGICRNDIVVNHKYCH